MMMMMVVEEGEAMVKRWSVDEGVYEEIESNVDVSEVRAYVQESILLHHPNHPNHPNHYR